MSDLEKYLALRDALSNLYKDLLVIGDVRLLDKFNEIATAMARLDPRPPEVLDDPPHWLRTPRAPRPRQ